MKIRKKPANSFSTPDPKGLLWKANKLKYAFIQGFLKFCKFGSRVESKVMVFYMLFYVRLG